MKVCESAGQCLCPTNQARLHEDGILRKADLRRQQCHRASLQAIWEDGHHRLWSTRLKIREMAKLGARDLSLHPQSIYSILFLGEETAGQEATIRTKHGTDWFKPGKGVCQGCIHCHPVCLSSMQSTSWEMPGWMNHKQESKLQGEISITTDVKIPPPFRQKAKKN